MSTYASTPRSEEELRYPVGRFKRPGTADALAMEEALQILGELPQNLRTAVDDLSFGQLATTYRDGGWTVRQVVHHVADSHMNAYIRFKLALTEQSPAIRPYDEAVWAKLHDGLDAPVEWSLDLLESLHARWLMLLRSLTQKQWQRTYQHPEMGVVSLETGLFLYAWHSRHHVAHITHLRSAMGW